MYLFVTMPPECCLKGCRSKYEPNQSEVTFHSFPQNKVQTQSWLASIGEDNLNPRVSFDVICSLHFEQHCFNQTANQNTLRSNAVPTIFPWNNRDLNIPVLHETEQHGASNIIEQDRQSTCDEICVICLHNDARLQIMDSQQHEQYQQLTGLEVPPASLCPVCRQQLRRHAALRRRALHAHRTLAAWRHGGADRLEALLSKRSFEAADSSQYNLDLKCVALESFSLEPHVKEEKEVTVFAEAMEIKEESGDYCADASPKEEDRLSSDGESSSDVPIQQLKRTIVEGTTEPKKGTRKPTGERRGKPPDPRLAAQFSVRALSPDAQLAELHRRRLNANYRRAAYRCEYCCRGFAEREAYECHMIRHTEKCGPHPCPVCRLHFPRAQLASKHATAHHARLYQCNGCEFVTTTRESARLHERWHRGVTYPCPSCPDTFAKHSTFMGHLRIKHPSAHACELCGFSFVSRRGVLAHKIRKHRLDEGTLPPDAPSCALCDVKFISEAALRTHQRVSPNHQGPDGKQANALKKKTVHTRDSTAHRDRMPYLKEHLDSLPGLQAPGESRPYDEEQAGKADGPIPCEQCGAEQRGWRAYHAHFRKSHPDKNRTRYPAARAPAMCEVCGKILQNQAALSDHARLHAPAARALACPRCPRAYRTRQQLALHARAHAPAARRALYACEACGKAFSNPSNRRRHMFIHTGQKQFKCELCAKGFRTPGEKRSHVAYVHLKKPWPKRARAKRTGGELPVAVMD